MNLDESQNLIEKNSKNINSQLDFFEKKLLELKILYEQYFCDLLPLQPEIEHQEMKNLVRALLRTPFKNSQANFRLKNLILRFQTLQTYWERVLKQREDGSYKGDKFRANLRIKIKEELAHKKKDSLNKEECMMQDLYKCYKKALKENGITNNEIDYNSFKSSLKNKSELLMKEKNAPSVNFRVAIEKGKVSIKARVGE